MLPDVEAELAAADLFDDESRAGLGMRGIGRSLCCRSWRKRKAETRFVPARVRRQSVQQSGIHEGAGRTDGWQKRAWLDGDWDIAAGQFFTTFRREVHVMSILMTRGRVEWFAAMDYGFTHYTVVLLGCTDGDGNMFIVDEHAERLWLPQRHAAAIKAMLARHRSLGRWQIGHGGPETVRGGRGCVQQAERWHDGGVAVCEAGDYACGARTRTG